MQATKKHISDLVEFYIKENPEEFELVKEGVRMSRLLLKDNKYAQAEGSQAEMRGLFEIPETLSTMLIMGLSEDESIWFKTKVGGRWFANKFKVFSLPQNI